MNEDATNVRASVKSMKVLCSQLVETNGKNQNCKLIKERLQIC